MAFLAGWWILVVPSLLAFVELSLNTVGGQILISENTCKDANIDLQIAGQLQIESKGMKHPVTICEIRGIGGKYNLFLPK